MAKKKMKARFRHIGSTIVLLCIGAALGLGMIGFIEWQIPDDLPPGEEILRLAAALVFMYGSVFAQIVAHEAGHLVMGLATGYQFSSFRIGSMMLMKEDGKLVRKKMHIAGTGGQCLMLPPEWNDGKFPVVLYNLGGVMMNLLVSAVFLALFLVAEQGSYWAMLCIMMAMVGILLALTNGIPLRTSTINNDGSNAVSLRKSKESLRAFWVQMKASELLTKGLRLRDMPAEWFAVPSDEAMKNSMVATIGVFACNRLVDQHRFDEARTLIEHMLEIDSGMVGIHRNLLVCDLVYLDLVGGERTDRLDLLKTPNQKKFMKAMKTSPGVIRTEYAHALLAEKDTAKAQVILARFEKIAKTYPYPNDIHSERELIEIAKNLQNV